MSFDRLSLSQPGQPVIGANPNFPAARIVFVLNRSHVPGKDHLFARADENAQRFTAPHRLAGRVQKRKLTHGRRGKLLRDNNFFQTEQICVGQGRAANFHGDAGERCNGRHILSCAVVTAAGEEERSGIRNRVPAVTRSGSDTSLNQATRRQRPEWP